MVARVMAVKPTAQQSEVVRAINARMRTVISSRVYWADLLATRIISCPATYNTGTVTFATGSALVTGAATAWPVSDVVNSTVAAAVTDTGYQEITPAAMTNIAVDTMLFCDATGTPETVAVVEVTPTTFWAKFTLSHSVGFTITSSSLAGLQILPGSTYPWFSIRAIRAATTLEMDNPWGGPAVAASTYNIVKMYTPIDPNLKVILDCVDQQTGRKLETYTRLEKINVIDPQRTYSGDPLALVQIKPTEAGSFLYEIWPHPSSARQLQVFIGLQPADLKLPTDRPPSFIDPNLYVTGACADVLRIKNIRFGPMATEDPFFNMELAREYEQKFRIELVDAIRADEAKHQRDYSDNALAGYGGGGSWYQSHDADLNAWRI